jgi:hypothetical protein
MTPLKARYGSYRMVLTIPRNVPVRICPLCLLMTPMDEMFLNQRDELVCSRCFYMELDGK